jgi:hypothetical protein
MGKLFAFFRIFFQSFPIVFFGKSLTLLWL